MLGTSGRPATEGGAAPDLKTRIVYEGSYPDDPRRCLLYQIGDTVNLLINTAHGAEAYDHAAHHAEGGVAGLAFWCRTDRPCGYRGAPEAVGPAPRGGPRPTAPPSG